MLIVSDIEDVTDATRQIKHLWRRLHLADYPTQKLTTYLPMFYDGMPRELHQAVVRLKRIQGVAEIHVTIGESEVNPHVAYISVKADNEDRWGPPGAWRNTLFTRSVAQAVGRSLIHVDFDAEQLMSTVGPSRPN
jgi:hypothetical protein